MDKYVIKGGKPLYGEVEVSGAKNAAVAIIPAALMVNGTCRLENIPQISDADMLMTILEHLGAKIKLVNRNAVDIDCTDVRYTDAPYDLMRKIRASYYLIGAMLGRFGAAKTTMPGGCNFGVRPIDQHIKGMTALGADVEVSGGFVYAKAIDGKLHGTRIYLDKVSVGATMNIILAASMARGRTVIENAAKEPHIVDLANFLNSMGADVRGAGTDSVKINGADSLHGGTYTIIPDQIEAGTYMVAAAAAGGEVRLTGVDYRAVSTVALSLAESGCEVRSEADAVSLRSTGALRSVRPVRTAPYPGFPTDAQPVLMAALLRSEGCTVFVENIFENRYRHVDELSRMGAEIRVVGRVAVVNGVRTLHGAAVKCTDLRGGAALVIAGLSAEGTTRVTELTHIDRGYDAIERDLAALGAQIRRETT